jgi:MFS family permease
VGGSGGRHHDANDSDGVNAGGTLLNGAQLNVRRLDLTGAVAISLLVQALISLLAASPPVLASHIAAARGWNVAAISLYAPITYFVGFMVNFRIARLLSLFGGMGLSLVLVALGAAGLLCLLSVDVFVVALTPLLVGVMVGAMNPASSQILGPRITPHTAGLIMSLKQTGVPIGGALAGLVIPVIVAWHGDWRDSVIALAALSAVTIAVLAPTVSWLNGQRPRAPTKAYQPFDPVKNLWAMPGMGRLLLAGSAFSAVQLSLRSFFTVYLMEDLGFDLTTAGLAFSATQLAGIFGQVGWAVVSDRIMTAHSVMGIVGFLMAAGGLLTASLEASWPAAAILVVAVLYGVSAGGFIPIVLAEVARRATAEEVGALTGGANLFLIVGVLVGPLLFGAVSTALGNAAGFVALCACALAGTLVVISSASNLGKPRRVKSAD